VRRDTLIDFFDDLARARGDFLVHDDGYRSRKFTYREVGTAARGFAARLHDAGLRKGDTVIFFSENRPEWIVAFWGCLLGGIVVVPIDYRTSPDFLTRVSRIVSAKLPDLTPHKLRHAFASAAEDVGLSVPTIGALLGHADSGVTQGYIHKVDPVLVEAANRVADYIARSMSAKASNVIPLKERRA